MKLAGQLGGAVLAGGKSSRMGRNKALLRVDGQPLWRRQLGVLAQAGAKPVLLVQAPGQRALRRRVVRDTVCDAGPLAGLHAALSACEPPWLAVLAVDMPGIDADWFGRLARHCHVDRGAVVRTPDGYEPLAAIYPRAALPEIVKRLAAEKFSLQQLLTTLVRRGLMTSVPLRRADQARVANWNTPADVA
ncbi:MAG: molybdenum cofactor guanylyltransferase [Opitutae bacterium]|nr:molybdenum cofactor guanylyltransferase [Opitutae bacterium]